MIVYDCQNDDDRFRWDVYSDNSIRPRNDDSLCIEHDYDYESGELIGLKLILDICNAQYKDFSWKEMSNRRMLSLEADDDELQETIDFGASEDCTDSPNGWYDIFGRNCNWYANNDNCGTFGDQYGRFGKTALSAVSSISWSMFFLSSFGTFPLTLKLVLFIKVLCMSRRNVAWFSSRWGYSSASQIRTWRISIVLGCTQLV